MAFATLAMNAVLLQFLKRTVAKTIILIHIMTLFYSFILEILMNFFKNTAHYSRGESCKLVDTFHWKLKYTYYMEKSVLFIMAEIDEYDYR